MGCTNSICPKKDETFRVWVDYCRLNAATKQDFYLIPRMQHWLAWRCNRFLTLDANSKYWQIKGDGADKDKTAFTCEHGLYHLVLRSFGLHNAPGTFQRTLNMILSSVKGQFALVYLEDKIIFSKMIQQKIDHLRKVLSLLHSAGPH